MATTAPVWSVHRGPRGPTEPKIHHNPKNRRPSPKIGGPITEKPPPRPRQGARRGRCGSEHRPCLIRHGPCLNRHGPCRSEHGRSLNRHGRCGSEHGRCLNRHGRCGSGHRRSGSEDRAIGSGDRVSRIRSGPFGNATADKGKSEDTRRSCLTIPLVHPHNILSDPRGEPSEGLLRAWERRSMLTDRLSILHIVGKGTCPEIMIRSTLCLAICWSRVSRPTPARIASGPTERTPEC